MGFKYRSPGIKIGGARIRKNKNGYSFSRKTITGGRKTYNTGTGKTTTTHKTGIKGLSYQTVTGGKTNSRGNNNGLSLWIYILLSPFILIYWIFKFYYLIFKYICIGISKMINSKKGSSSTNDK